MHTLPTAIEQRVLPESFLNRCCPGDALWPGWSLLAQKGQEHFVACANRLRRKQPEVSNPVPVTIRDLIRKAGDELARGVAGGDGLLQLLIFGQKTDILATLAGEQPVLCKGRAAQVTGDVAKEPALGFEVFDLCAPPAVAVRLEQLFKLRPGMFTGEQTGFQGHRKVIEQGMTPFFDNDILTEPNPRHQPVLCLMQAHG